MRSTTISAFRRSLLVATTGFAIAASTGAHAQGQPAPSDSEEDPSIVIRNDLDPNAPPPGGVLDSGISGVGQMTVRSSPTSPAWACARAR